MSVKQMDRDHRNLEEDLAVLNALAAAYAGFGEYQTAFTLLDMSRCLHPKMSETHKILAIVAMQAGDAETALTALDALDKLAVPLDDGMQRLWSHATALRDTVRR